VKHIQRAYNLLMVNILLIDGLIFSVRMYLHFAAIIAPIIDARWKMFIWQVFPMKFIVKIFQYINLFFYNEYFQCKINPKYYMVFVKTMLNFARHKSFQFFRYTIPCDDNFDVIILLTLPCRHMLFKVQKSAAKVMKSHCRLSWPIYLQLYYDFYPA